MRPAEPAKRLRRRGAAATLLVALAMVVVPGCGGGSGSSSGSGSATTPQPRITVTTESLERLLGRLAEAVGTDEIEAVTFGIYPGYALVEARDPDQPTHIDQYQWRDGAMQPPDLVRFSPSRIDESVFRLDRIVWEGIPARVREAPDLVDVEGGVVTSLTAFRSGDEIRINIRVDGPRYGGSVILGSRGQIIDVSID